MDNNSALVLITTVICITIMINKFIKAWGNRKM